MVASTVTELFEGSPSTLTFDDGTVLGAAAIAAEGRRLASALADQGANPGDRIAVHLPNGADYVRLLLACAAGGFVAVSVNTRYTDAEVTDLIGRSGARVPELAGRWRSAHPVVRECAPDDPFVVFTTSGTTGAPKMVLHLQRSIAVHAAHAAAAVGYAPDDTVLVAMPLCGTFGLTSLTAAVAGGSSIVVTNFDVERTARLVETHRVTAANGSDDMFHRLIVHGADLSTIRHAGVARFNTSLDDVVADADRCGATLVGLYGMSEVQALFTVRDPATGVDVRRRPGGTLASPAARYRVVDGELQVQGPSLMAGYLAEGGARLDAELTSEHVHDGWFRTGDLAAAEGARSFEFLARRGDVLRLGGFLVHPTEIESVIAGVPGVEAAQVVAIDRPEGTRPVAFVIGNADEATVIGACREHLAIHKSPIRVFSLDEFPTTPSANGTKVRRGRLRELAADLVDG